MSLKFEQSLFPFFVKYATCCSKASVSDSFCTGSLVNFCLQAFFYIPTSGQSWMGITLLILVKCVALWTNGGEDSFLAKWPRFVILITWLAVISVVAVIINYTWETQEHTGLFFMKIQVQESREIALCISGDIFASQERRFF